MNKDQESQDDESKAWLVTSRQKRFENSWLAIYEETTLLPNHKNFVFTIAQASNWVSIIPITAEGNFLLVEQYRPAWKSTSLEFPAGKIEGQESPEQAAMREMQEETGYVPNTLELLYKARPVTWTTQWVYAFLAKDLKFSPRAADESEFITTIEVKPTEFERLMKEERIIELQTIALFYYFKQNGDHKL